MPAADPPRRYDGQPNRFLLRRGSCLWRVHHRPYSACSFKPTRPGVPATARFDGSADDPYPYFYSALDDRTALAETLLRNLVPDERGNRLLPLAALAGRRLSGLTLTRDLTLVSLISGPDLAAIGQDAWLVTAHGAADYEETRRWGHWLRQQATWAHGFVWESLRNRSEPALILFGDRCAAEFGAGYERALLHEVPELAIDLDEKDGTAWLREVLSGYRVTIPAARSYR